LSIDGFDCAQVSYVDERTRKWAGMQEEREGRCSSSIRSEGAQQSEETMLSLRAQLVGLTVQRAIT